MSKKANKISLIYSWPVIILITVLFWPVGLFLIIKRISMDKKAALASGKIIKGLGIASCCLGALGFLVSVSDGFDSSDVIAIIFFVGAGYITILQTTKVWSKQLFPQTSKGQFEGIWILFFVLFPMIGGSLVGEAVVKQTGETFINELSGKTEYIPNGNIYLYGIIFVILSAIPFLMTLKEFKKRTAVEK